MDGFNHYSDEDKKGKSKTTAIILAVLFAYWTWLYTYQADHGKFWVGIGYASFFAFVDWIISSGSREMGLLFNLVISLPIWIWAMLDTAEKDGKWYDSY